jgi:hypothetical protein
MSVDEEVSKKNSPASLARLRRYHEDLIHPPEIIPEPEKETKEAIANEKMRLRSRVREIEEKAKSARKLKYETILYKAKKRVLTKRRQKIDKESKAYLSKAEVPVPQITAPPLQDYIKKCNIRTKYAWSLFQRLLFTFHSWRQIGDKYQPNVAFFSIEIPVHPSSPDRPPHLIGVNLRNPHIPDNSHQPFVPGYKGAATP